MTFVVLTRDFRSEGTEPVEIEVKADTFSNVGDYGKPHSIAFYVNGLGREPGHSVAQFPFDNVIRVTEKEK